MRLLTYASEHGLYPGLVVDDKQILDLTRAWPLAQAVGVLNKNLATPGSIIELIMAGQDTWAACNALMGIAGDKLMSDAWVSASKAELVAPIPRPLKNVFCVGSNYRAHVSEANRAQARADNAPKLPVFFTKPPTAVVGPHAAIRLDPNLSVKMDYEVELAVVIGKEGRDIPAADAFDHIFGFTIVNDVTARDLQRAHGGQFLKGKGLDTTCPMGPHIVTMDELSDFESLRVSTKVNGEMRQDGNTRDMIFSISRLLESLSEGLTLEPGDILATGTPSGVGYAMDPPNFLQDGDQITCEIQGIGQLINIVRNSESSAFVT